MSYIAFGPKQQSADVLVWRGGSQFVFLLPLLSMPLLCLGPRWFTLIGLLAPWVLILTGPRRRVTFDLGKREIRIGGEWLFGRGASQLIRFDRVEELAVGSSNKHRPLVVRTAEGDFPLLLLIQTYGNAKALEIVLTLFAGPKPQAAGGDCRLGADLLPSKIRSSSANPVTSASSSICDRVDVCEPRKA